MTCRKLAFDTVEAAERTASVVAAFRGPEGKVPVRIYECPDCGHLHFTSTPERSDSSTVAHLSIVPAFTAEDYAVGKPIPCESPCALCGNDGAQFELHGRLYHRTCRTKAMTPAERAKWKQQQSLDGMRRTLEAAGYTVIPPEVKP